MFFLSLVLSLCTPFQRVFLQSLETSQLTLPSPAFHVTLCLSASLAHLALRFVFALLTRFIRVSAPEIAFHPFRFSSLSLHIFHLLLPISHKRLFFPIASSLTFIRALLETFLLSQLTPEARGEREAKTPAAASSLTFPSLSLFGLWG